MYRGFNLKLDWYDENYFQIGKALFNEDRSVVKKVLESFVTVKDALKGTKMQENWFPQVEADIFLSHSHNNEKMAIALAGCLNENFGIMTFIDSCIWGYADELLKIIDNAHCLIHHLL